MKDASLRNVIVICVTVVICTLVFSFVYATVNRYHNYKDFCIDTWHNYIVYPDGNGDVKSATSIYR